MSDDIFQFTADDLCGVITRNSRQLAAYVEANGLMSEWVQVQATLDRMNVMVSRIHQMVAEAKAAHESREHVN